MSSYPEATILPPISWSMRMRIDATIEQLVALLDEDEGDSDLELPNDQEDCEELPAF